MHNGVAKYDLTEEEFQRCLNTIEMSIFLNSNSYEKPKSIFIVAQPGSGKTGLKSFVLNENQLTNPGIFTEFNPDEIAVYHTYYSKIIEEYPEESYSQLQKFISPALDGYLLKKAVALRNNILQEGTFGNTEQYLSMLDFRKNGGRAKIGKIKGDKTREEVEVEGGYSIDINILAVHRFESLLSAYEREQYFKDSNLVPRTVDPKNHDRAYYQMLETLKQIEERQLFDRMRVFKRSENILEPELVYIARRGKYPSVIQYIEEIREENKKQLLQKPEEYLSRIAKLKSKKMSINLLKKVEKLEKEFMNEIEKENDEEQEI